MNLKVSFNLISFSFSILIRYVLVPAIVLMYQLFVLSREIMSKKKSKEMMMTESIMCLLFTHHTISSCTNKKLSK